MSLRLVQRKSEKEKMMNLNISLSGSESLMHQEKSMYIYCLIIFSMEFVCVFVCALVHGLD